MIALHRFGSSETVSHIDPTAMLALGFVILASFTIGALVDVIRLPHITGYLLAGMFFGPSIASETLWAPFDRGVLHDEVIQQLSPLETLAVALIAITAGGELFLDSLKKGLRAITSVLVLQLIFVLAGVTGFFYAISGVIPELMLPGLPDLGDATLPVGLTVAAISFATSPAATIAVISDTGAKGPMSRTVLSTVVLKDVFVVVLFGVFSAWAIQLLPGAAQAEGDLVTELSIHILGSIAMGCALGAFMAFYLRFINKELLLFIAGVVYTGTFVATEAHLDSVLVFLTAGFVVSNFSRSGHTLIHAVERLSLPVYVVFFTLAGAKLHLDELMAVLLFAISLVTVRILSIWIGVRLGGIVGKADPGTTKHGWMGFVSQAGVAITFAGFVGNRFGEHGAALSNLIIAGVALNEILGPVLLKVSLGLAGEIGSREGNRVEEELDDDALARVSIVSWPTPVDDVDWGPVPATGVRRVDQELARLREELQALANDVAEGPMEELFESSERFYKTLRRGYLREHRRLLVSARGVPSSASEELSEEEVHKERMAFAGQLRGSETELAETWRELLLARSAQVRRGTRWTPHALVERLDDLCTTVSKEVQLPYNERSFLPQEDDGFLKSTGRTGLRVRRAFSKLIRREQTRSVPLGELATFHLAFETPPRLEGVAALYVQVEQQMVGRTRMLFDEVIRGFDDLAERVSETDCDPAELLAAHRQDLEEAINVAIEEARRIAEDGAIRTARFFARAVKDLESDLEIAGTFELPSRSRRASRAFSDRIEALDSLTTRLSALQRAGGGEYASLAMELELVGHEARIKDSLARHAENIEADVRARGTEQANRVASAFRKTLDECEAIVQKQGAAEMAAAIRDAIEPAQKVSADALGLVRGLRDSLLEEQKLSRLLDALSVEASKLSVRYEVAGGRLQRGEYRLPPNLESVDVPFRQMVLDFIETRVTPQLLRTARSSADRLVPLEDGIRDAERLLAFNRDLALAELDLSVDDQITSETRTMLEELLATQFERSETVMSGLASETTRWPDELGDAIRDAVIGSFDELRGELIDGAISRSKVGQMRRNASRRRLAQRFGQLPTAFSEFFGEAQRVIVGLVGAQRVERLRRTLGLRTKQETQETTQVELAAPSASVELPLVYRRVFAADSTDARDVPSSREWVVERARTALEAKAVDGRLRNVAIVGLDGTGREAVVTAATRGGRFRRIAQIEFTKPTDVRALNEALAEAHDAQLIVVRGVHWLLSAKPDGFTPLRELVRVVAGDAGRRAWLIEAERTFWSYASSASGIAQAFPTAFELTPLSVQELTAAVLERHRWSGFSHVFSPLEGGSRAERLVGRLAGRIRRPMDRYFLELHNATGGLVQDALRLWLASIQAIEGDEMVRVGRSPQGSYSAVSRLADDDLLILMQIMRQGWMDEQCLAWLMTESEGSAQARLGALTHLGLLSKSEGAYQVRAHLRGAIARVLEQRGWIE